MAKCGKALPNCGMEERLRELSRKNEEYSQMIQRLLNTVETEREIYEKRLRDLTKESDEHIRRLANKCRDQKLQLINRNIEIEREMKRIIDTKECTYAESSKAVEELQERLSKALCQLECKSKVLKEVECERDKLRKVNKRLECKLKDHQIRTTNYKNMLEQEVCDLKSKLKSAEKKNVELLNDSLIKETACSKSIPLVKDSCDDCERYCGSVKSITTCHSPIAACEARIFQDTVGDDYCRSDSFLNAASSCSQNMTKETCCLIISIVVFAITFFLKALGNDRGCNYIKRPYQPGDH